MYNDTMIHYAHDNVFFLGFNMSRVQVVRNLIRNECVTSLWFDKVNRKQITDTIWITMFKVGSLS